MEGGICFTKSPVHTIDYFIDFGKKLSAEGADRLALKDMAGLLLPQDAIELIPRLQTETGLPLSFHAHATTGLALLNSVIAMNAGVDLIDTSITPFAGGTAHPPIEILIVFAEMMGFEHNLDKELILEIQADLFNIYEELQHSIPYYGKYYRPFTYEDVDRSVWLKR